jgi:hypothetical protein
LLYHCIERTTHGDYIEANFCCKWCRTHSSGFESAYSAGAEQQAVLAAVRALCPLPESAHEITSVARSLDGLGAGVTVRLGEQAPESDIKLLSAQGQLERYKIVHFATHGLLAGDLQLLSSRDGEPGLREYMTGENSTIVWAVKVKRSNAK